MIRKTLLRQRLCVGLVLFFLGGCAVPALIPPPTPNLPTATPTPEMTDKEKIMSWKGEKVILLGDRPDRPWSLIAQGLPLPGRENNFYHYDNPDQGLPLKKYAGQIGTITDLIPVTSEGISWTDMVITLDKTNEKIVGESSGSLGFFSEMDIAKSYIGRLLWAKGKMTLAKSCDVVLPESQLEKFEIKNTQKIVVTRAEWGEPFQPIFLYLKTEDGQEGCLLKSGDFDSRFHLSDEGVKASYIADFYTEDPRTLFIGWSEDTWKLIENEQIAIGMTEDMAKAACGRNIETIGVTLSPSGSSSPIYKCGDTSFLVEDGKVTKYVK